MSDSEAEAFDLETLIGVNCQIQPELKPMSKGGVWTALGEIKPLVAGTPKIAASGLPLPRNVEKLVAQGDFSAFAETPSSSENDVPPPSDDSAPPEEEFPTDDLPF